MIHGEGIEKDRSWVMAGNGSGEITCIHCGKLNTFKYMVLVSSDTVDTSIMDYPTRSKAGSAKKKRK